MNPRHAAIITAAGSSQRFNASSDSKLKKEYAKIGSESVLAHAVTPFVTVPDLVAIVVTYRKGELEMAKEAVGNIGFKVTFVEGGETRRDSVFNALKYLYDRRNELDIGLVSIHDGARPFVTSDLIKACLDAASSFGGSCPCLRVTDTIVRVGSDGLLTERISRDGVCTVQTPQTFRFPDIYLAHLKASPDKAYTDDTEIFMDYGGKVRFVQGDEANRKITFASDLKEVK